MDAPGAPEGACPLRLRAHVQAGGGCAESAGVHGAQRAVESRQPHAPQEPAMTYILLADLLLATAAAVGAVSVDDPFIAALFVVVAVAMLVHAVAIWVEM